jgi:hypothetical protein
MVAPKVEVAALLHTAYGKKCGRAIPLLEGTRAMRAVTTAFRGEAAVYAAKALEPLAAPCEALAVGSFNGWRTRLLIARIDDAGVRRAGERGHARITTRGGGGAQS